MTQTASHQTVLLQEAVDALNIKPNGRYIDCTFGRGGHSRKILQALDVSGRLLALDRDKAAIEAAQAIEDARFTIEHCHFSGLDLAAAKLGWPQVDGILLDLGISSPQIDEGVRGFSFMREGPLDMRMDQTQGKTAAEVLMEISEKALGEVIKSYGEERYAKQIARKIIEERENGRFISTTAQLAQIVASTIPKAEPGQNPATRTFQALRIFVNQELEELSLALAKCMQLLNAGGRLVVISFHSLEDRMVKQFIRDQENRDDFPKHFAIRAQDLPKSKLLSIGKAIKPNADEVAKNPRARSAIMRVAERTLAV